MCFLCLALQLKIYYAFYCMLEAKKKFRSTKFLCDNKKFRLANNIDAYAITLFFSRGSYRETE